MLVFEHEAQRTVAATPDAVFRVLADPARHTELAGSGEVRAVRVHRPGAVGVGSTFEADEQIRLGRNTQSFTAVSTITEYDPPHVISWTTMPPNRPRPRRIQWWFLLEQLQSGGTRVTERVEVDLGALPNLVMKLPYGRLRAPTVRAGMARTLENLERASSPVPGPRLGLAD